MHNLSGSQPGPPFFSIVIPAYNAATFIADTLDSVREQSFADYEVLVTNDGSQDDTGEMVARYAAKYPLFPLQLASQENKGIGGARNNGLLRATGEFVAFLDADDCWYPHKLERMAALLLKQAQIDVAWHDEIEVTGDGGRTSLHYDDVGEPPYEDLLFRGNRLSTSATVVRRELARRVGGFSENMDFNSAEDYEFWLRLAAAGARFAHLPELLGEYHRVEGSVTQKIEYHYRNIFNVVKHHLDLLSRAGKHTPHFMQKIYRRKEAEHLAALARGYAGTGEKALAIRTHCQAMQVDLFCWKNYTKLLRTLMGC